MVKIRTHIEFEEPNWRKMDSYHKLMEQLTHEQGCELNSVLWDYWQEIIGAINKD